MGREGCIRGGLADHRGINLGTACRVIFGAFACDFFIGDKDSQQRARPCGAIGCEHAHGLQHGRQRPLAVAGATPMQPPIRLLQRERIR